MVGIGPEGYGVPLNLLGISNLSSAPSPEHGFDKWGWTEATQGH